jgi:hypothetical protein
VHGFIGVLSGQLSKLADEPIDIRAINSLRHGSIGSNREYGTGVSPVCFFARPGAVFGLKIILA